MGNLTFAATITGAIVVLLLIVGIMLTRLYKRASKEMSFVRTGIGGQKVVKDGGSLVLPVFHETIAINMQTLCLNVTRENAEALITKDRLRVNVKAEFYVRVKPDADSIAVAAQTLGRRTLDPHQLSELIQGKFVDALRAAAAGMEMQDLHEKRSEFVHTVQTTVAEDLTKNGLELETVSLTGLDQTDAKYFNPQNAFDAEGLTKLTAVTQARAQERNEIEQNARIAIETKNLEADSKSLELKQAQQFNNLEQEKQVETRRANQESELASKRAESKKTADLAQIEADRLVEEGKIAKTQAINIAQTEAAKNLELAAQDQRIAVANRSEAQSEAEAAAQKARSEAIAATEAVKTVQATAEANRTKEVAVIAAEQVAQEGAVGIRIRAEAELAAADAQAQAKERLVEAEAKRYTVEANGQRALNEAANLQSAESMAFEIRQAVVRAMPDIIREMARPIEKIDSIRVVSMPNMGNGSGGGAVGGLGQTGAAPTGNLSTDLVNGMLNYRMQVPIIDELAAEIGIDLKEGLNGLPLGQKPTARVQAAPQSSTDEAPRSEERQVLREDTIDAIPDEPLSAEAKAAIQTLAGITDGGKPAPRATGQRNR